MFHVFNKLKIKIRLQFIWPPIIFEYIFQIYFLQLCVFICIFYLPFLRSFSAPQIIYLFSFEAVLGRSEQRKILGRSCIPLKPRDIVFFVQFDLQYIIYSNNLCTILFSSFDFFECIKFFDQLIYA